MLTGRWDLKAAWAQSALEKEERATQKEHRAKAREMGRKCVVPDGFTQTLSPRKSGQLSSPFALPPPPSSLVGQGGGRCGRWTRPPSRMSSTASLPYPDSPYAGKVWESICLQTSSALDESAALNGEAAIQVQEVKPSAYPGGYIRGGFVICGLMIWSLASSDRSRIVHKHGRDHQE